MNHFTFLATLLSIVGITNAWTVSPQKLAQRAFATFGTAAMLASGPMVSTAGAVDYIGGSYDDPNHPNCQRVISVSDKTAKISGTDGNPGCPADGSGKAWTLTGSVTGKSILVDFSPKGGPKDLIGVFEGNGIVWPDGNKWTLKN